MTLFGRSLARRAGGRGDPPREVVALAVPRGESVLAAALAADDTWLLATRHALHAVRPGDVVRLRWEDVHRAEWDRDTATLTVQAVRNFGEPVATTTYEVQEPGALVPFVRERVDASIVLQRRVRVTGKRGFTVVGRRPPSGSAPVTWFFEFDPGVDPQDPVVAAATDVALGEAEESLGL